MRAALVQMTSGDAPATNLATARAAVAQAAAQGAGFVLTPEVTNCVSTSRSHQNAVLRAEGDDPVLDGLRDAAARHGLWLLIGSLALKTDDADGRFANRSILVTPEGRIAARYDKIHMFDVEIGPGESYRESDGFRPGDRAVVVDTPFATLGLSICYDIRFPHLYRALAQAGAEVICVPSAFSPVTGAAHWDSLLRARAIETGCYVLAPAQCGAHPASRGKPRQTYGHSMAVAPWGEVLARADDAPTTVYVDLDRAAVEKARARVPSLRHDREFDLPL